MAEIKNLSHFDQTGRAVMVDVSAKRESQRTARAQAVVRMQPTVIAALPDNPKGDPLEVARIAGILAAKRTADLIPMCHPLPLTHVDVQVTVLADRIRIEATAATLAPTGVEMEALTAASLAALTVYDMTKALDPGATITDICLLEKTGGQSGHYQRSAP